MMRGRERLNDLNDIASVRSIQVDIANQALRQTQALRESAMRARCDAEERRDMAAQSWIDNLQSTSPNPILMSMSGRWLVERESDLRAADLGETIAQRNNDAAELALAMRQAELENARQIGAKVSRRIRKQAMEHHALELADSFLRRTSR